jgi:myo-inositol-1(or 4)-monophosphatase
VTAEVKADQSPVTVVDRQVEDFLIWRIAERYPHHTVLSEESGLHLADAEVAWVLDPIDGTRAFASGLPIWGVSIGVFSQSHSIAGGFYMPVTREMYWSDGQYAYYNDQPIRPVTSVDLDSVLAFLAVPSEAHLHYQIRYPRVRSMGSTAAHLAYVATGAAVGALMRTAKLWDVAGVLPVLQATGIDLAYLDGQPFQPEALMQGETLRAPLLAAHPSVMQALRERISLL